VNILKFASSKTADTHIARKKETALLVRVRDESDEAAFEEFFSIFTPKLVAWAIGRGCSAAEADSVIQDVMLTAWTRSKSFDASKASARTWMYTLARNKMIDLYRSNKRRSSAYEEAADISNILDIAEPEQAQTDVVRSEIYEMLKQLPDEQSQSLYKVYFQGKSHREIAEELDIPIGTVKSRTRLAFQKLRKGLTGQIL
jgi:RNA polymerase sigma-70 factor, ECF subfamily